MPEKSGMDAAPCAARSAAPTASVCPKVGVAAATTDATNKRTSRRWAIIPTSLASFLRASSCVAVSASLGSRASHSELVGEVVEVLAHDVERPLRFGFTGARAAFPRPPDMTGAQPQLLGGRQVAAVGGTHHDLLGLEVERLASHQIDLRLRLVALRDLGAENCIPGKVVASPHIGHQRNVAV